MKNYHGLIKPATYLLEAEPKYKEIDEKLDAKNATLHNVAPGDKSPYILHHKEHLQLKDDLNVVYARESDACALSIIAAAKKKGHHPAIIPYKLCS